MTDARVSRTICAKLMRRQHDGRQDQVFDRRACAPTVGRNQPSWMPKKYCATKPTTKIGSEMSMRLTTRRARVEDAALAQAADEADDDAGDHLEEDRQQRESEGDREACEPGPR